MAKIFAIINPKAGQGRILALWERVEQSLYEHIGVFDYRFTRYEKEATYLTREALKKGFDWIITVGGDGTLHEVVNGFFEHDTLINPHAKLSLLSAGSGCDFAKSLPLPQDIFAQIKALQSPKSRTLYPGKASITQEDATQTSYYFCNVASFGLSGFIAHALKKPWARLLMRIFGVKQGFYLISFMKLLSFKAAAVSVKNYSNTQEPLTLCALAKGCYFGGGMYIAPDAQLDTKLFEIIVVRKLRWYQFIFHKRKLYQGAHLKLHFVTHFNAQELEADSDQKVYVELDGEACGILPAYFTHSHQSLTIYY